MKRTYLTSLAPGLVGLGLGVLITEFPGDPSAYEKLSQFQLWRGVVIVQVGVFVALAAYLLDIANDSWPPQLSPRATWADWLYRPSTPLKIF